MNVARWEIRPQYISMVKRYQSEEDVARKIKMKHKFIDWIGSNHNSLTDAEIEYLQASICPVEDIYL